MNHSHGKARQYSDSMVCSDCGRSWDVNDTDPPPCERVERPPVVRQPPPRKSGKRVTSQHWADLRHAMESNDWSKFDENNNR